MITSDWQASAAVSRPLRPARLWYWAAGGLLATAVICILLGVAGFFSLNRQIKEFQRVAVPGRSEVTFAQPGGYVLYLERPGGCCSANVGSGNGATAPFPSWSMEVGLQPVNGGPPVSIRDWSGATESYGAAGHEGQAAMSFTIDHPGRYVFAARDATPRSITDIAVGRGIGRAIAVPIVLILVGVLVLACALTAGGITAFRRRRARQGLLAAPAIMRQAPAPPPAGGWQPDPAWRPGDQFRDGTGPADYARDDPAPPAAPSSRGIDPAAPSAILVGFAGPAKQNRLTVLVRILLAIPHFICLYLAAIAAQVVLVVGWFGALFTGRLPQPAADYLSGYLRWKIRLYAYLLLLTDRYPPFTLEDDDYPVRVLVRPGRLNRLAVLFRIILVIPAEAVAGLVNLGLTTIVAFVTWLIVLVTGRMPQPLHQAISAALRYQARVRGYFYLLTSALPRGLFGDQPSPGLAAEAGGYLGNPDPEVARATPPPGSAAVSAGWTSGWSVPDQRMWPLVLSRPARGLVGMFISLGAVIMVGAYIVPLVIALAPASHGTSVAGPAATALAPAAAAPSPIPTDAAPAAVPSATRALSGGEVAWLAGISSLKMTMAQAMASGSMVINSASLRMIAGQLRHCTTDLAKLGPATKPLQPVYRIARQSCAQYERGAACASAAARIPFGPTGIASAKLNRLIDCSLAGVNRGSARMADAVVKGDEIQGAS